MQLKRARIAVTLFASASLALSGVPATAFADDPADLQSKVNDAYSTLMTYSNELEAANNELYQLQSDLESVQAEIQQTEADIEEKQQELEQGQAELSQRLAETYKQNSSNSTLSVVLGASDFEELLSRVYYANSMANRDAELIDQVKQTQQELEQKKSDLATQEQEQQQLVSDQQQKTEDIQSKVSEQQSYYNSLDSELQTALAEEAARAAAEQAAAEEAANNNQGGGSDNGNSNNDNGGSGDNGGSNDNGGGSNNGGSNDNGGSSNNGGSSGGGGSNNNTDSGNAPSSVVDIALAQVGKPYVFGTEGPDTFDCSGLVQYSYKRVGISLPHSSQAQCDLVKNKGHLVTNTSYLSPGDLVFWGYGGSSSSIYHVGIYIGGGRYVHASSPGVGVITSSLSSNSRNFVGGGSPV